MGLLAIIGRYRQQRQERKVQEEKQRYLEQNTWEGLVPGDLVEYKGKQYMYKGINQSGGPGNPLSLPEPEFTTPKPSDPWQVWYLRTEEVMTGEVPDVMKESAERVGYGSGYVGFLNAKRSDFKKVDHITPEEWKRLSEELKRTLSGKD